MNLFAYLKRVFLREPEPENLRRGRLGERAAKRFLCRQGLKFLTANFRSPRGEIDLVFRDRKHKGIRKWFANGADDCLVFVEVKTRSSSAWERPAAAVDADKRRLISRCALDYLKLLKNPRVKVRFDIVEVILEEGEVCEVRHLPHTFSLSEPYKY